MMNTISDKISNRLFAGIHLTSELKMHLSQSVKWKHVSILPGSQSSELVQAHYQEKDYLGLYILNNQMTLLDLKETEAVIFQKFQTYCPNISLDMLKISVFAQVFVC